MTVLPPPAASALATEGNVTKSLQNFILLHKKAIILYPLSKACKKHLETLTILKLQLSHSLTSELLHVSRQRQKKKNCLSVEKGKSTSFRAKTHVSIVSKKKKSKTEIDIGPLGFTDFGGTGATCGACTCNCLQAPESILHNLWSNLIFPKSVFKLVGHR